jgi:hypothetical protein
VEAEARAKAALLAGPLRGRALLRPHGGVLVRDDGAVIELPRAPRPRVVVRGGRIAGVAA